MADFKMRFREMEDGMRVSFGERVETVTSDYEKLLNKPKIEGVLLLGDKSFEELGLRAITPQEIDDMIFGGD